MEDSSELQSEDEDTIQEISEIIRELGIVLEDRLFLIKIPIFTDRKSGKEIEDKGLFAILCDIFDRIDHIADALAHLLSIDREVSCDEKSCREFISCREEHCWPVHRMKSHDIFSEDMEDSIMILLLLSPPLLLFSLTDGEIVEEGIIPDIGHLLRIEWQRNPEFIRLSTH